jgi:hypothetical protein
MCAWQFSDSFDCYAAPADAINGYWDSGANAANASLVAGRFAGSQALQTSSGATNVFLVKSSGQNDALHHITIAFRQSTAISGTTIYAALSLFDGTTAQCSIAFRSDGAILLTAGLGSGATLATYTGAFPVASTWYAFEFEVLISNTAGYIKVRKNGNTTEDFTSATNLNTRATANNYANKLQVGNVSAGNGQQLDDLYWRSDASSLPWFGDMKCMARAPASDASVQFSRTPTGVLTQTVPVAALSAFILSGTASYTAFTATYSGTVTSVGVGVSTLGNAVNMKCAIFADDGSGRPGALLSSATAPVTPVAAGTNTFAFAGQSVVKGTQYWIGAAMDGTTGAFSTHSASAATGASNVVAYASFPQTNPVTTMPAVTGLKTWTYTATPANWQAVSEPQQDATTSYVYDSVPGHADLYGIAPIASTPLTTFAVVTRAYMIKSDAGTRTAAVQLRSGGTTDASPTVVLTPSNWQWAWKHYTSDPAGGAWTAAAVNVAQCGPVIVA